jgi:hypothetical protein
MLFPRIFRRQAPKISKEQARTIAQNECKLRQWPFEEPVNIRLTFVKRRWAIYTAADSTGGNVWMYIDANTGQVLSAGFAPR